MAPAAAQNNPAGQIDRATLQRELGTAFASADTNKDGVISLEEANAAEARAAAQAAAIAEKRLEQEFAKLDTDKNGQLSLAEFKAAIRAPQVASGAQIMQMLDANHDGKVTLAEFSAQRLAMFNRLDTNHDGVVTAQERQAAAARH